MVTGADGTEATSGRGTGRVLLALTTILLLIAIPQLIYRTCLLLELGSEAAAKLSRAGALPLTHAMLTARSGALVPEGRRLDEVQHLKFVVGCVGHAMLVELLLLCRRGGWPLLHLREPSNLLFHLCTAKLLLLLHNVVEWLLRLHVELEGAQLALVVDFLDDIGAARRQHLAPLWHTVFHVLIGYIF